MKTFLRIPHKPAPEAPSWMYKKKAGRKLDPIEAEEYYKWKSDREVEELQKRPNFDGVPTYAALINSIRKYHVFKKSCLMSFYDCQGNRHNKYAFAGPYDECGKLDVFGIWKNNVKEKRAKQFVDLLVDHYEFPLHDTPRGMEDTINTFYQAKYGMFTCHDTLQRIGKVRQPEDLIAHWQRNKDDQKYTWHVAIASHIAKGTFNWDSIKDHKKNFREGKAYKAYLRNHQQHESELQEMVQRLQAQSFFEESDQKSLDQMKEHKI